MNTGDLPVLQNTNEFDAFDKTQRHLPSYATIAYLDTTIKLRPIIIITYNKYQYPLGSAFLVKETHLH